MSLTNKSQLVSRSADTAMADYLAGFALVLGLDLHSDWRENVLANLRLLSEAAELVSVFPLDDTVEAASVFRA